MRRDLHPIPNTNANPQKQDQLHKRSSRKPHPEKSSGVSANRHDVANLLYQFYDESPPAERRIFAALSLAEGMPHLEDPDLIYETIFALKEAMLDDSELPSIRNASALALSVVLGPALVRDAQSVLDSDESTESKFLAVRMLSFAGTQEAKKCLANVARSFDDERVRAAAREAAQPASQHYSDWLSFNLRQMKTPP